jgi:hypothetical protein
MILYLKQNSELMCDLHSFIHRFRLKLKEIEFKIFNFACNNGH